MTRKKKTPTAALIRSSAAEYLALVAASGTGGVKAVYADENVWLSQTIKGVAMDDERLKRGSLASPVDAGSSLSIVERIAERAA